MKRSQQFIIGSLLPLVVACGDSGVETTDAGTYSGDQNADDNSTDWTATTLAALGDNGYLQPNIQTFIEGDELHIFYYDDHTVVDGKTFDFGEEFEADFDLMYVVWDIADGEITTGPEVVQTLDNSSSLSAAYDGVDDQANVIYQGGYIVDSCQTDQSNTMVSSLDTLSWYEEAAAIGYVDRTINVLEDGLAGGAMDIAIDDDGNRHIVYQFYYEGCGTGELTNPDLNYVHLDANADYSNLDNDDYSALEEQVDGNSYDSGYDLNDVGDVNSIVINTDGNPVVLYSEAQDVTTDNYGLKMATRNAADDWSVEWITEFDECEVEGLDAAINPDGEISAAVYTYGCVSDDDERDDDWHKLHYLSQSDTGWDLYTMNTSVQIGKYPSLAFDADGNPVIAYYEIESYAGSERENLKIAYRQDGSWSLDEVSNYDDIGKYNQLKITDEGKALLVSYYDSSNSIMLFEKDL